MDTFFIKMHNIYKTRNGPFFVMHITSLPQPGARGRSLRPLLVQRRPTVDERQWRQEGVRVGSAGRTGEGAPDGQRGEKMQHFLLFIYTFIFSF